MMVAQDASCVKIPAVLPYVEPCLAYVESLVAVKGFSDDEAAKIRLAIEEALSFAIENFFDRNNCDDQLELYFDITPAAFHCTIRDQGMPFNLDAFPGYEAASDPDDLRVDGLGIFLIRQLMDEMTFVYKGRQGKEWHLVKKKSGEHIGQLLTEVEKNIDVEDKDALVKSGFSIRWFVPEDAWNLSRSAYQTYGYGYKDFIFYPDELIRLNQEKILRSLVIVTDSGEIAGHGGIYAPEESPDLVEWRTAFVNPAYRRMNAFDSLQARTEQETIDLGYAGAYVISVGSHTFSQKICIKHGMKSCGVLLATMPGSLGINKGLTAATLERYYTVMKYKGFRSDRMPCLCFPEKHCEMIIAIYRNISRDFQEGPRGICEPEADSCTMMSSHQDSVINVAEIKVWDYGPDVMEKIRTQWHFRRLEHNDVIYLYLNLEHPYTRELVMYCEKMGFFFAGILPDALPGHDALVLQYLNNIVVDYSTITPICPFARQIVDYIRSEDNMISY